MNIRYPIYEGVYRILTYVFNVDESEFILRACLGCFSMSHVFFF